MESVITELRQLGERFVTYVQHLKLLKNEEDVSSLKKAICILENDLKVLRMSYECQINHLVTTLNVVLEEKKDLEGEILVRKENDAHFMDRISVESLKNAKLLQEISRLKTEVADKTNQITSLKLRIQELDTDKEEKDSVKLKLTEEINLLKQKLSMSEDLYNETANQLQSALLKLDSQKMFAKERLSRSQNRIQWFISQIAAKDLQVEESRRKEASISTVITQLRAKAQEELIHYRQQASEIYKKPMSTLQNQLVSERKENQLLKTKCLKNDQTILDLQRQVAELNSKVCSSESHTELLKNALESLGKEYSRLRTKYEDKIQKLEASVASNASDFDLMRSKEHEIMEELSKFKKMLDSDEDGFHLLTPEKQMDLANVKIDNQESLECLENEEKIEFDRNDAPKPTSFVDFADPSKSAHSVMITSDNELHDTSHTNYDQENFDIKKYDQKSSKITTIDLKIDNSIPGSPTSLSSLSGSNAIGHLQICEIDSNGEYLLLWNSSINKEIDIGLYKVWQKHGHEKMNEFTFPPDIQISPRTVFTLWSNNATIIPKNVQNSKTQFRCPNVCKWFTDPNYITIISNSYDEILAWLAPSTRCFTSRTGREHSQQIYNPCGFHYVPNLSRDSLTITRQKSSNNNLSSSSTNNQYQPTNSTQLLLLPNDTEANDTVVHRINYHGKTASQFHLNDLYKQQSIGTMNVNMDRASVTHKNNNNNHNNDHNNNNNNNNINNVKDRNLLKSKNLITLNPPNLLHNKFILNDKMVPYSSHKPYYSFLRQLSIDTDRTS
ncbi:unnamed protein product [Schistosoma turkestanicum]|nr:unnamed protein product [Schistosoma turkestanicum]